MPVVSVESKVRSENIAVIGAVGGIGQSTVAVLLSSWLARSLQKSVHVIDGTQCDRPRDHSNRDVPSFDSRALNGSSDEHRVLTWNREMPEPFSAELTVWDLCTDWFLDHGWSPQSKVEDTWHVPAHPERLLVVVGPDQYSQRIGADVCHQLLQRSGMCETGPRRCALVVNYWQPAPPTSGNFLPRHKPEGLVRVATLPFDPHLASGSRIAPGRLSPQSRAAWNQLGEVVMGP